MGARTGPWRRSYRPSKWSFADRSQLDGSRAESVHRRAAPTSARTPFRSVGSNAAARSSKPAAAGCATHGVAATVTAGDNMAVALRAVSERRRSSASSHKAEFPQQPSRRA
eukprot:6350336-Prymnesium_polylepis.4